MVARFVRLAIVSGFLLLPAAAWAQQASASIAGVVKDTSGAVMPGVTVEAASPALLEKVRSVVTDAQGQYKIVDLRPGNYTVTFSVPGFSTVKREGIELTTSFTANVNADLKVGAVEETVTVSGAAPLVDTQNVNQQTSVGRGTLNVLPTTQRVGQYAMFIPAAVYANPTFQDVGGNNGEGGQFSVHGQRPGDTGYNFEGMNQNMYGGDVYSYNAQMVQEVVVETGGTSAEALSGGPQLNIIGKDGGNIFSGSYSTTLTGPSLASDNLTDKLRARGLLNGISIKQFRDHGGALGGPIKRDTLWFFTAHRFWESSKYIQGSYYNKLQGTLFYAPDLNRVTYTDFYYHDNNLRLTWQAAPKHKIVAYYSIQNNCNCPFALSGNGGVNPIKGAPESRPRHVFNPQYNAVVSWSNPATNRLLFEGNLSLQGNKEHTELMPDVGPNDISVTDLGLNLQYGSLAGSNTGTNNWNGSHQRRFATMITSRLAASYVTGTHNFKIGFNYQRWNEGLEGAYTDPNAIHGAISYNFRNQAPTGVVIWAEPFGLVEHTTKIGVFAQDQWTVRKLTLNLGLRYDALNGTIPAHHLPAGIYVPARDFPAVSDAPDWKNLNPRLGASYNLFGDGRTALKASLGRYVPYTIAASNNPAANQAVTTGRTWNDADGNYVPNCDLTNPNANGECGAWSDRTFGQLRAGTRFADDALGGFNKQFANWQGSVSIQQQLRQGMALNVGYFRTWYRNFLVTKNAAVTPADFDSYCLTVPSDSRLSNSGQQLCGFYDVKPQLFGAVDNVRTLASNYGKRTEVYNGVDVSLTMRPTQETQFSGGLSIGRTVTDACDLIAKVPEALFGLDPAANTGPGTLTSGTPGSWSPIQNCHLVRPWSAATQAKFLAVFPLPWGFSASAVYQNIPGIPVTATDPATNAQIRPSLGRDLASCRGAAVCNATVNLELLNPASAFEDRLQQVDLRLSRRFQVRRFRVRGSLDVANLFNASSVLAENAGYGSQWLVPYETLGGRLFRVNAQVEF